MKNTSCSVVLLALFLLSPKASGTCIDYGDYIHWLGALGLGGSNAYEKDIFVSGTTAYAVPAASLRIIDVSNPASPSLLGSVNITGGGSGILQTTGVTVVGSTAYVTGAYRGLFIIDVSNPASPAIVGFVDTPGVAEDVAIAGNRAYVADYASGLQVIDIPTRTIIGHVDTPGNAFGVALNGNIAYVADEFVGVQVISISNPASPVILATVPNPGTVQAPGNAQDVEAVGSMVYVADGKSGLVVIDASNPSTPMMVGNADTPGYAWDLRLQGTTAFVADDTNGFTIIDISNPTTPVIVGNAHSAPGRVTRAVAVSGTTGLDFSGSSLLTIDISSFASVPVTAILPVTPPFGSTGPDAVAASGSLVCASHGTAFVSVFDVSDPTSPVHLSSFTVGPNPNEWGIATNVAVSGSMAYATYRFSSYGGLLVVDLSTPASPQILGHLDLPPALDVDVSGTTAFVSTFGAFPDGFTSSNHFCIVDASDPSHPILVGGENPAYVLPVGSITVKNSLAFINVGSGIEVVDISNLTSPAVVGQIDLSDLGVEQVPITLSGNYGFVPIYTQTSGAGVLVLQIFPYPEAVHRLGLAFAPLGDRSGALAVSGLMVYDPVTIGRTEMFVVDASNPSAPRFVGDANVSAGPVVMSGTSVCSIAPEGLTVLPIHCSSPTAVADPPLSLHPTLGAAFPNPTLSSSTMIPFTLAQPGHVTLRIVDTQGREVRTLVNDVLEAGEGRAQWDGRNARGERVPAGIYIYELRGPGVNTARKLVRLR